MQIKYIYLFLTIIGLIAFVVMLEIFRTKCPACGRMFARQIFKGKGRVDHMQTSMDSVHIEGTRMCKCKYCGHEWSQRYSKRRSR
jgi:hypothetical protein